MENFLYKCELCTVAKFSIVDKGEVWFIDCMACGSMQFHHKIVIVSIECGSSIGMFGSHSYGFECKMDRELKEEKNVDSNTRTDQEK